ncbi:zinc ribbon domain-containing protein [Pelagibius sp.]|uniref:FmdB family zinc ribbon protein n=1 Tax=Pelagibius sp. TaxID=1931238 RepID=UPI00260E952C|nr:zinc ribbon domain-containing protein [Pelagibius sp.]
MPLYNYDCAQCGEFDDWRSMSEASEPSVCPDCGDLAPRAVSAPNLAMMPRHNRIAHERNEKSAHEPRFMSKAEQQAIGRKRSGHDHHHHGHGHGHAHGSSGRPWMIGH